MHPQPRGFQQYDPQLNHVQLNHVQPHGPFGPIFRLPSPPYTWWGCAMDSRCCCDPWWGCVIDTRYYDNPWWRSVIDNADIRYWSRQTPPLQGGPERRTERPPHSQHIDFSSMFPQEVILHGPTDKKEVALTFDDGPDPVWTPQVLNVLTEYNVKATFMCVGSRVRRNPEVLQQLVRDGHIIGNHTYTHPNLTKIPATEVRTQIERTSAVIQRVANIRPRLFRPPYGALTVEVIREIMELNYKIIYWDVDSLDWSGLTDEQVTANVLGHVRPGSIVLMHSAGGEGQSLTDTVQALPHIIEVVRYEGYRFVTVPELLDIPAYR